MQCKCGGETRYQEHEIKSAETAFDWTGIKFKQHELPVMVGRNVCVCGRQGPITVNRYCNGNQTQKQNATKGEQL